MVKALLALVTALVAVVAGTSKVTLTVGVSGNGAVTSKPAGIACPSSCKLRVTKGTRVTLTALPKADAAFSHWSAPCGSSSKCTLKVTGARVVRAFFTQQPTTTPQPLPPPPPPLPVVKAGHYVGTYTDGAFISFDVQTLQLTNLAFGFNGHCSDGGTMADDNVSITGLFPIASDGSFSGPITLTYSNASGTATFAGKGTSAGLASGTLNVSITFSDGTNCTSSGTWTAQDQS